MTAVEFRLLGGVEAHVGGRAVDVGHARQRCVLAVLLLEANRAVPVDTLVDRAWERPPQRPRNALAGYLSRLRGLLSDTGVTLSRRPDGYMIVVDPDGVDVHRFRRLAAQARAAGDEDAVRLFDEGLRLWRGEPFARFDTPWLDAVRLGLAAERLQALLERNDAALRLGRHGDLLADLTRLVAEHPLDERLAGQLMLAQYHSGRQADATRQFERTRLRLADELGADPGPGLREVHQRILRGDAAPAGSAHGEHRHAPVPRQVPAPPASLIGREPELAALDAAAGHGDGVVIHAISGTAGVGKTTLALHWAHRVADRFPDGQLYANLRGFDPGAPPVAPAAVLRQFLEALDVAADRIPIDVEAQSAMYRSLLAGRRVLVVLDNAGSVDQVRPLLPAGAGCAVLVTSRTRLTGLVVADGARPLVLKLLSPPASRDLLADRIGADLLATHQQAVDDIVARCAGLPLALAIVAARVSTHEAVGLHDLAAELRDVPDPLDALRDHDPAADVRTVFSWSYRSLGPDPARLFRRIGLHPGPDIGMAAAASLDNTTVDAVRPVLAELLRANLLAEHTPNRFSLHDLLRAYAAGLAHTVDDESDRLAATLRVMDHYLHTAQAADRLLNPGRGPLTVAVTPASAGVTPEHLADGAQAMAWFTAEIDVLVAVTEHARRLDLDAHAWQLPMTLASFLGRRGRWHEWAATQRQAVEVAQGLDDHAAEALAQRGLGRALVRLDRHADAMLHLRRALDLYGLLGDVAEQAHTQLNMAWVMGLGGRPQDALPLAHAALTCFRKLGRLDGEARALSALAWYQTNLDQHDQAIEACRRAIDLFQKTADLHGEAATWDSAGVAHRRLRRHDEAVTCFERAHDLLQIVGDRYPSAEVLIHLGDTQEEAGHPDRAREAWQQALSILEDIRHPGAGDVRARLLAHSQAARRNLTHSQAS